MPSPPKAVLGIIGREETDLGDELQSGIQCTLLDGRPLAKPGGIHPVLVAARPALVVHVFRHGVEQAPGGLLGRLQLRSPPLAFIESLNPFQSSLVGEF